MKHHILQLCAFFCNFDRKLVGNILQGHIVKNKHILIFWGLYIYVR